MNKSESIAKLASALVKAQGEIEAVSHDSENPFYKSKYASLGAVISETKPAMQKNGLSIHQFPAEHDGRVGIETVLLHESGEYMSETILVAVPEGKKPGEEAGKIITYLRRYAWASVLGLYTGDDDDLASSHKQARTESKGVINFDNLVNAGLFENVFSAQNAVKHAKLGQHSTNEAWLIWWSKQYRARKDQGDTTDQAVAFSNNAYVEAIKNKKEG